MFIRDRDLNRDANGRPNPGNGPQNPANPQNRQNQNGPPSKIFLNKQISASDPLLNQNNKMNLKVSHCATLKPWQIEAANTLKNNDLMAIVGAGGGKTLPIICHYINNVLNLNVINNKGSINNIRENFRVFLTEPHKLPKLIFLVPIQRLVDGQYKELYETACNIITSYIINFAKATSSTSTGIIETFRWIYEISKNAHKLDNKSHDNIFMELKKYDSIYKKYLNNPQQNYKDLELQQEVIINRFSEIIKDYVEKYIVGGKHGQNEFGNGDISKKPMITCVYESITSVLSDNEIAGLRNSIIVLDEAHLIQARDENEYTRATNICEKLYYHVFKNFKFGNNNRIAMLTGTINPKSADNLTKYFDKHFGRNFRTIQPGQTAGNVSTINIIPFNGLLQEDTIVNLIKKPIDTNNLFVFFSKNIINNIVHKVVDSTASTSLQNIENNIYNKKYKDTNIFNYNNSPNYDPNNAFEDTINKTLEDLKTSELTARDISSRDLSECIKRGFGYIYRNTNLPKSEENDVTIVQDLFISGKIHSLLATDAVGIGININVKNLYIAATEKFDGKGQKELMISNLNQLLNRAGRGKFNIANIYVPDMYIDSVTAAISSLPDNYEMGVTIEFSRITNFKEGNIFTAILPLIRRNVYLPGKIKNDTKDAINNKIDIVKDHTKIGVDKFKNTKIAKGAIIVVEKTKQLLVYILQKFINFINPHLNNIKTNTINRTTQLTKDVVDALSQYLIDAENKLEILRQQLGVNHPTVQKFANIIKLCYQKFKWLINWWKQFNQKNPINYGNVTF